MYCGGWEMVLRPPNHWPAGRPSRRERRGAAAILARAALR